jgi:hypothetical protein
MEEIIDNQPDPPPVPPAINKKNQKLPKVIVERDLKDYVGESMLIVFSVLLALILTEIINKIHENQQAKEIVKGLRAELSENERLETEQYAYHLQVLKNIDSALHYTDYQKKFIDNGMIDFDIIAPRGVLLHDLNDVAWQVAKQANIISKIGNTEYGVLTNIYDNQERFLNLEREIAAVILSRESRMAADNRITLILVRDNYTGWVVSRAPALLNNYRKAIQMLEKYQ